MEDFNPDKYTIKFFKDEHEEIGCLDFSTGVLKFDGKAEESAKIFFEAILKDLVDEYLKNNSKKSKGKRSWFLK